MRGISELGCWLGIIWFWKRGWRNRPRVPTTQTITKIHRNIRSTTMATYFQSSITCKYTEMKSKLFSVPVIQMCHNISYTGINHIKSVVLQGGEMNNPDSGCFQCHAHMQPLGGRESNWVLSEWVNKWGSKHNNTTLIYTYIHYIHEHIM